MTFKSEFLALIFGITLILITFGDQPLGRVQDTTIGNLDTIFGLKLWPVMDVIYPLLAIIVFLLYGWVKSGKFKVKPTTLLLFLSFLAALFLISTDDIAQVFHITIQLSRRYWISVSLTYMVVSSFAFFLYGKFNEKRPKSNS
jgi:hypothetical protein